MKTLFTIGTESGNDILINDQKCPAINAKIYYQRGHWVLEVLEGIEHVMLNNRRVTSPQNLSKYDIINICGQSIYWCNHLSEGDRQQLVKKDFITFNGRISRSNFRVISLLSFGVSICIFFIPGLLVIILRLMKRLFRGADFDVEKLIQYIAPFIHSIGYVILGLFLINLAVKRMRDTGHPLWKLLVPFYNLKLLYFEKSKM